MSIIPIGKRVLCKKIKEESKTESGLIIPTDQKSRKRYTIVSVGDGCDSNGMHQWMSFKVGDTIYTKDDYNSMISKGDDELFIVCIDDIIAIEKE